MVTPSRLFTSAKPSPTEQRDDPIERENLRAALDPRGGVEVSILSDETRLETDRPALTRDGLYLVNLVMTVGADQHRRTIVVKAREGETESAVKRRVHSAFVRSVCNARSVVLASAPAEDEASPRSRRVQIR
jgi:hypothetical protein